MDTLGGYLKEAREEQGLTYEQLTAKTRIPEKHLEALEEEDYQRLPAKVFTKGFVRSYARALALDEEEAVRRFLETSSAYYASTEQEEHYAQIPREDISRSSLNLNWKIIAGGCLLIGGLIFFLVPGQQEEPKEAPEPLTSSSEVITPEQESRVDTPVAQQPDPGEPSSESSISEKPPESIVHTPPPKPLPEKVSEKPKPVPSSPPPVVETPPSPIEKPPVAPAVTQTLEIEATQLTWVVVQSDEDDPNEALLQPGQRMTWEAKEQFLLTLGNAAGVVVKLNGEAKGPFGKPGQVIRNIRLKP